MKKFIIASISFMSLSAFAEPMCYQLSKDSKSFSKTPETLCIETLPNDLTNNIKLETGLFQKQLIAEFNLDFIPSSGGEMIFGVKTPENSIFNKLQIIIKNCNTKINEDLSQDELCEILIGQNEFFGLRSF